jgi:hypothetical protein
MESHLRRQYSSYIIVFLMFYITTQIMSAKLCTCEGIEEKEEEGTGEEKEE